MFGFSEYAMYVSYVVDNYSFEVFVELCKKWVCVSGGKFGILF